MTYKGDHDIGFYESDPDKIAVMDGGTKIWEGSITEYGKLLDLLRTIAAALTEDEMIDPLEDIE